MLPVLRISLLLSVPEKLVLSKGLSFIPTAKDLTNFEILSDFNLFTHKLRKCINPPCTNPCTDGFPLYRHDNNMNTKPSLLSTYPQFEGALNSIKNQLSELPTHQSNTPGIRPIVSCCQSPTENISQFVDFWLQPHVKMLPSFLRDSSQFIAEIEQLVIPPHSLLVTIDVTSLYTNIPHKEGIKSCHNAFIKLESTNPQQPPAETLTNLLEIVLKNNVFEFNGKCYKQLFGTAMGSKTAPSYANTFLGNLENKFLTPNLLSLYTIGVILTTSSWYSPTPRRVGFVHESYEPITSIYEIYF